MYYFLSRLLALCLFCLQTSSIAEFREFYRRAVVFAETDPSVLSKSVEVHRDKVARGRYAYFALFGSLAEQWRATDCEIVAFSERLTISSFGFYLRKGSPYTKLISEMWVALLITWCFCCCCCVWDCMHAHIFKIYFSVRTAFKRYRWPHTPSCKSTQQIYISAVKAQDVLDLSERMRYSGTARSSYFPFVGALSLSLLT